MGHAHTKNTELDKTGDKGLYACLLLSEWPFKLRTLGDAEMDAVLQLVTNCSILFQPSEYPHMRSS